MKQASLLIFIVLLCSCGSTKEVVSKPEVDNTSAVEISKEKVVPAEEVVDAKPLTMDPPNNVKDATLTTTLDISEEKEKTIQPEIFNHSVWNDLVSQHVSEDGRVNYEGFRQEKGVLRDYIASLGANMPTEEWTHEDKLAYWMNAYNAMTVDLILRNLPLQSIKDIDKPWNQRLWKLGDKWYNLDEIEHKILRKMGDPRIHFGINCASFSCPPLLNEAFTSQKVEQQLESLSRTFVNDSKRNTISENSVQVSKIFSWFASDFKQKGTLIDFINTYSKTTINANARVRYRDYDWQLNK